MNTNEEHIKSHFPALYKDPSAPSWANTNSNFQSGGLLPVHPQWITLSPSWDRLSSCTIFVLSARLRALPSASQVYFAHLLSKAWGTYLWDVSLQYSKEGTTLRNKEWKRFTHTKMPATFSLKATQCQVSPCSRSYLPQYGDTSLHSTVRQHRGRGLGLNPAHALLVGYKEIRYISLLKIS